VAGIPEVVCGVSEAEELTEMNLLALTSSELKAMLTLRLEIEKQEEMLHAIFSEAGRRPPVKGQKSELIPRRRQPSLRELISGILGKAKKPLSVADTYEATLVQDYHWRSGDPINALNVKMYTDPTFKKVSPGRFVLRKK
jgi:hypothetical protein